MKSLRSTTRTTVRAMVCFALLLTLAALANAQTFVTNPSSTTLWAGVDNPFVALGSFTVPGPGVILPGTAISPITGKPVRHLWLGDAINGLCRVDPEVDQVVPAVAGVGGHVLNFLTCVGSIGGASFLPGQITYDPVSQMLYTVDTSRTNAGILRMQYVPSGDSGQGSINRLSVISLLGGSTLFRGGCAQLKDPKTGSLVPIVPSSAALGPDGNLYTGSIRDGAIIRIASPATFNPVTDCPASSNNLPTDKINIPILSTDEQFGSGHTFGLGFIGATLVGADNLAPWVLLNATQCYTPANNNKMCASPALGGQAPMPTEVLTTQFPGPQGGAVTDAQFPTSSGTVAYFAQFPSVAKVTNLVSATSMTVQLNYGGTFSFITGLTADPGNTTNLFVGTDQTQGGISGGGGIWQVSSVCPPAPAFAPISVSATANGSAGASVSWVPASSCNAATSYVVRTLLAPAVAGGTPSPSTVPDLTVAAPTTAATLSGLTVGTSYVFEVEACNLIGCSAFSPLSNVVTPILVQPPVVTNVVAADAGTGTSANVAWTVTSNGTITSSTVSAFDTLAPTVVASTATVAGTATAAIVGGLTCGHTYTFSVVASNTAGASAPSAQSLPLTLACPVNADVSLLISSPATINPGSLLTYTLTVRNAGPASAFLVTLADTLPAPFVSSTTTQGVCVGTAGQLSMTCNLGSLASGATATVTVTVQTSATAACTAITLTNTATASALNSAGGNIDPNLANNTASASTATAIPSTCTATTTDIQVNGSAQNGGPAVGSNDTFTWQIKNNLGTTPANGVVFSSNMSGFSQVVATPSQGTCSVFNNAIQCQLGTINGGQQAIVTVNFNVGTVAGQFLTGGSATFIGTDTNPANNSSTISIQTK